MQFFEDIKEGEEYPMANWPLHTTVADIFAVDLMGTHFIEHLEILLKDVPPITTTVGDDNYFGPNADVHVALIKNTPDLQILHDGIVSLLELSGAKFNNPEFIHKGFLPHSTVQKHGRMNKDDTVTFDALSIIDMFPGGDWQQRKVLKTIKLRGK